MGVKWECMCVSVWKVRKSDKAFQDEDTFAFSVYCNFLNQGAEGGGRSQ